MCLFCLMKSFTRSDKNLPVFTAYEHEMTRLIDFLLSFNTIVEAPRCEKNKFFESTMDKQKPQYIESKLSLKRLNAFYFSTILLRKHRTNKM